MVCGGAVNSTGIKWECVGVWGNVVVGNQNGVNCKPGTVTSVNYTTGNKGGAKINVSTNNQTGKPCVCVTATKRKPERGVCAGKNVNQYNVTNQKERNRPKSNVNVCVRGVCVGRTGNRGVWCVCGGGVKCPVKSRVNQPCMCV